MSDELTKVAEHLIKQLPAEKVYADAVQGAAQETGKTLTDLIKCARLLLAPIQLGAAYQDRFARFVKRIAEKVPEERQVEVHPAISGPVLEALRYMPEGDLLTEYMLNLLAAAMDGDRVQDVHPAFSGIAPQLCPDEAMILYHLKQKAYALHQFSKYFPATRTFGPRETERNEFPTDALAQPSLFFLYMDHLHHLGLAGVWQHGNQTPTNDKSGAQTGTRIESRITLTQFGEMFCRACVPEVLPKGDTN